jgi:hypothetical protein
MKSHGFVVGLLVLGLAGVAPLAARADLGGVAPRAGGQGANPPAPGRDHSDDSQSLRRGVVTNRSANGEQIEIQGRWHRVDPVRTRILRAGQVVRADAISKGQTLEFTLLPGREAQRGLGVVYVR